MLREFRDGTTPVLVATDIAARGIDVKDIDLVINYDLPMEPEVYIHRIGRTARAGATGSAISLCSPDEIKYAKSIQKMLGNKIPLHEGSLPQPLEMEMRQSQEPSRNRRRGASRRPQNNGNDNRREPSAPPRRRRSNHPGRSFSREGR